MFLLVVLFLKSIFSIILELKQNHSDELRENVKAGYKYRLEYSVDTGDNVLFNVIDNKGRIIGEWNTSYSVIHINTDEDSTLFFNFKNLNPRSIHVRFITPDLDNEVTSTEITKGTSTEIIHKLEDKLKSIIYKTNNYLDRMKLYTDKMASYKWRIRVLMLFELIFCAAMIYFLHRDTVGLFERRRKL